MIKCTFGKYTVMSLAPGGVQFLMEILLSSFETFVMVISLTAGSNTVAALTRSDMGIHGEVFHYSFFDFLHKWWISGTCCTDFLDSSPD